MGVLKCNDYEGRTATIDGDTRTWAEWCDIYGIKRTTVYQRMYYNGCSFEQALGRGPARDPKWWTNARITIHGEKRSPNEWLNITGISKPCFYDRVNRLKMSIEEALSTPKRADATHMLITVDGETHTMEEWCRIKGIRLMRALKTYGETKNARYSIMTTAEKRAFLKKRADLGIENIRMLESRLASHPTQEVVEMCMRCPYKDCIYTIVKCLSLKHAKEEADGDDLQ